jgi:aspartate aminotransferase
MTQFATRIGRMKPSGIREVFNAASGDAINLGIGQPDFAPPDHAKEAAVEAIRSGAADDYTPNRGIPALREAIVAKHAADNGHDLSVDDVIATCGGSEALHLALEAHVDDGDEVVVPDPGFVAYDALTKVAGGDTVPVGLRDDLTIDPAAVEAAITDDTAAFVVNSPGNPTGTTSSASPTRCTSTPSSTGSSGRRWSSPSATTSSSSTRRRNCTR